MATNPNPVQLKSETSLGTNEPQLSEELSNKRFNDYVPNLPLSESIPLRFQFRRAEIADVNRDILDWAGLGKEHDPKTIKKAHELNDILKPDKPFNEDLPLEVAARMVARQQREKASNFVDSVSPFGTFISFLCRNSIVIKI